MITRVPKSFWYSMHLLTGGILGLRGMLHESYLKEYPKAVVEEHRKISEILLNLQKYFGLHLRMEVVEPQTPRGIWYSVKFRVKAYPCFIVDGKVKFEGIPSLEDLRRVIFNRVEF